MEIICDFREKQIIKKLNEIEDKKCIIKTENLNLGDFIIGNMIIERKTHNDLACSILDGRYKEQSNRLKEHINNNPKLKIVYFIEGNFDLFIHSHNVSKDKIISCILSLFYEKGFYVILTKHLNETCDFLLKFCDKYYTKYKNINNDENMNCLTFQTKKKNTQINKSNIGILMLTNIPNISNNIATQLLSHFNNDIYIFLSKLKENKNILDDIKLKIKDNKTKKIPKNIKNILIEYFIEE